MSEGYKHTEENIMASLGLSEEDFKKYAELSRQLETASQEEITTTLADDSDRSLTVMKLFEGLNIISGMLEKSAVEHAKAFSADDDSLKNLRKSISNVTSVAMILYKTGTQETKVVFLMILVALIGMIGVFPISSIVEMVDTSIRAKKLSLLDVIKATHLSQALMMEEPVEQKEKKEEETPKVN